MNRYAWVWPVIVIASVIATCGLVLTDNSSLLRTVLGLWFMLCVPGLAFVPLLRAVDRLFAVGLIIAISLGLNTLVGEIMLYGGFWSPKGGLVIVALLSLGGAILQVVTIRKWQTSRVSISFDMGGIVRKGPSKRTEARSDPNIVTDTRSAG